MLESTLPLKGRIMHEGHRTAGERGGMLVSVGGGYKKGKGAQGGPSGNGRARALRSGYMGKHSDRLDGGWKCWSWRLWIGW